jgi:hypothetical protein
VEHVPEGQQEMENAVARNQLNSFRDICTNADWTTCWQVEACKEWENLTELKCDLSLEADLIEEKIFRKAAMNSVGMEEIRLKRLAEREEDVVRRQEDVFMK